MTQGRSIPPEVWAIIVMALITLFCVLAFGDTETADVTIAKASWYSRESCRREGTGGKDIRTASGERLDDNALTCAVWGPKFGTMLKVTNLENGKSIVVRCNDRGPGRRGIIRVKIEIVEGK